MGFRVFGARWGGEVQRMQQRPARINARGASSSYVIRGPVVCASGPSRTSGYWWRADLWARDEWDVAVRSSSSEQSDVLSRVYRDLHSEEWFVEGVYS